MFRDSLDNPIRRDNIHQSKKVNKIELRSLRNKILCTSESPTNKSSKRGDVSP